LLQREARDAAKGKTQRCPDGMSRRECKKQLKKKSKRMKKNRQRNPKKGGKGRKGQRTAKGEPKRKRPGKGRPKKKEEKGKGKNRKKNQRRNPNRRKSQNKGLNEAGSSSGRSGSGRQDTCFTDMVAKTKKFNKAQVEFRLTKRIETWGKLMKNKKNNSASTFSDALEAMNEATGNGKSCEGDSSSLAEAKKVQEKLANCSTSAGANCDEGKLSIPINSTLVSTCKDTLEKFAKDFKECLTKSTDALVCSCVQGLTNPGSECLDFKDMHDGVKAQKEKCTKGSEEGSFGDCRKQERMAAKFGNKCKKSCSGPSVTTQAPAASQRMKLLRRLNQKIFF